MAGVHEVELHHQQDSNLSSAHKGWHVSGSPLWIWMDFWLKNLQPYQSLGPYEVWESAPNFWEDPCWWPFKGLHSYSWTWMLCTRCPLKPGILPFSLHKASGISGREAFLSRQVAVATVAMWFRRSGRTALQADSVYRSRFQRRSKASRRDPVAEPAPRCPPLTAPDCNEYETDLNRKTTVVQQLLAEHLAKDGVEMDVVPSPELLHYRHRLRFELRHAENETIQYIVMDPESQTWVPVQTYPIASQRINQLMSDLQAALAEEDKLRWRAFQVELLSNTAGDALAMIMYHRRLDDEDTSRAQDLAERLDATVVLRARRQRVAFPARRSYLVQENQVAGKSYPQRLLESSFFQANLQLNQLMQTWLVKEVGDMSERDLLEIYCGNGNFTLPAASSFRRVLATEMDGNSLTAAKACALETGIENLNFKKCRAEVMEFRELQNLGDYDFSTLLLDPPRAGLSDRAREMSSNFDRVIYISCNPRTLARDLAFMNQSKLRIQRACLFDQFPWTDHVEVALHLSKS